MMASEQWLELIFAAIGGLIGVPFTTWLKNMFNVDDTSALALSLASSILISVVVLILGGTLVFDDFTWAALPQTISVVWGTAVLVYNFLRGKK
jgi:hypothetical protein